MKIQIGLGHEISVKRELERKCSGYQMCVEELAWPWFGN